MNCGLHQGPGWLGLQRTVQGFNLVCKARAAVFPNGDGAVFVLRVFKLAVIRLLSNDVGELIRAVLMGALISLKCVMLMRP